MLNIGTEQVAGLFAGKMDGASWSDHVVMQRYVVTPGSPVRQESCAQITPNCYEQARGLPKAKNKLLKHF